MHPNRRCSRMPLHTPPKILLASPAPILLAAIEPVLLAAGNCVDIVLSAQAALAFVAGPHPPALALLDANLPGMPIVQVLAAVRARSEVGTLPIVLIADNVIQEWIDRLAEGTLDDL